MQAAFLFVAIVGGSTTTAILLLAVLRHKYPTILKPEDHEIAGHFLGVVGGFYGVLLAFVVVMIWGQFNEAKLVVTREANQAADLFLLARALPDPARSQLRVVLIDYERIVIDKEWDDMAAGQECNEAWAALANLWSKYQDFQPRTPVEAQAYQLSLTRLVELSDSRRMRLLYSREKVPGALWALLILGGVGTVSFTYFFRFEHRRAQAAITGILTALIAFILFLVMDFDQPFKGAVRISPEMLIRQLERMQSSMD